MTISQAYLKEIFDYKDGSLIRKIKTSNRVNVGDIAGSNSGNGYLRACVLGEYFYIHRLVFMWHFGYLPNEIDHIDGNKHNNTIENLREATHSQNGKNLTLRATNKVGLNGVRFDSERKKWSASICVDKRKKHLGRFVKIEDAINARKKLKLNFLENGVEPMRRAAKIDANQEAVVSALRAAGATVQSLAAIGKGVPDLLVGYKGQTLLMEIKDGRKPPSAQRLTEDQLTWHGNWKGGALAVVDGPEAALRMIGVI